MKKSLKTGFLAFVAVVSLAMAPGLSAQNSGIDELTSGLSSFTDNTIGSLPFAASAGIDWSNAYIGQLIDTDFPFVHLGLGLSTGFTTLPAKAVNPLLKAMDASELDVVPLPYAVVNARIGGLLLPFDVGLKAGFLPDALAGSVPKFKFRYQNFGIDARFNLIKSDVIMPDISVGGGINFLNIGVDRTLDFDTQFIADSTNTLELGAPQVTLNMQALDIEVKAQVSKTLLFIITPYVGAAAMVGSGTAKSGIGANVDSYQNGNPANKVPLSYWEQYGIKVNADGFTKNKESATFGVKLYGGASLNIFVLKIDGQAMFNLTDGAYGASLGARIQL